MYVTGSINWQLVIYTSKALRLYCNRELRCSRGTHRAKYRIPAAAALPGVNSRRVKDGPEFPVYSLEHLILMRDVEKLVMFVMRNVNGQHLTSTIDIKVLRESIECKIS